jgi:polysaccharide pyruvyl transferase WcaK-like protein
MRICIHGSYGTGNRGDSVILSQLLLLLAAELPGAEVTLLCRDEQRVALYLQSAHPDLDLRVKPLHASFRRHPLGVLRACLRCDLFILGGGGLLWGGAPGNLAYWLTRARLARLAGARLVFYLPGIYAVRGRIAHRLLGRVARSADFVSARDLEGVEQLRACGVPSVQIHLGADPAFLLPPPTPAAIADLLDALELRGRRLVGLSARDWRHRLSAGIFANFVRSLLEDEGIALLFFVMKTGGRLGETDTDDITVVRRLLGTLPAAMQQRVLIVDDRYDDGEMIALMAACQYLVAMRLHALIFASIAGTPFGALAYDDKIRAFMAMLGRQELLLGMDEVADPARLQTVTASLAAERDRWPAGPVPEIALAAASLAARAQTVHRALVEALRGWYPEARAGARKGGRREP